MRLPWLVLAAAWIALAAPAAAHVEERSGSFRVTLGWVDEPALSGAPNDVQVKVAGPGGAPVPVRAGALQVEVSFTGAATTLQLEPAGAPGELRAAIVPTRPGAYAFHVTGTVRGQDIDVRAPCGPGTFDCVTSATELQFPVKEPSAAQLAERLDRALPRAEDVGDKADSAQTLAVVALIVAAVALGLALVLGVRLVRKSG